jgi:hypothetical protein
MDQKATINLQDFTSQDLNANVLNQKDSLSSPVACYLKIMG